MAELALDSGEFQEDIEQQEEASTNAAQQAAKRQFNAWKKKAVGKAQKKVAQAAAKKLAQRAAVRTVAVAAGSTLVGLIVTYLIWTWQLIYANLLGHDKFLPKLVLWERVAWGFLTALLVLIVVIAGILLIGAFIFTNPAAASLIFGAAIVSNFF